MAAKKDDSISVVEVTKGSITFCVLGSTPLILHRMSEKAKQQLLLPAGRKTAAEKASSMKHDPVAEYRASAYQSVGDDHPTRLLQVSTSFKKSLASAALDMPGAAKAQIGRLTYVEGDYVGIYGTPKLFMAVTRSSDINRTPDIRTRAIVPEWAAFVTITFVKPIMRETVVANLFAAAGIMRGVGDWRPEKGSGSYGQFELVSADDERFKRIVAEQGREAQDKALAEPQPYDSESAEMLSWFKAEANRRGFQAVA